MKKATNITLTVLGLALSAGFAAALVDTAIASSKGDGERGGAYESSAEKAAGPALALERVAEILKEKGYRQVREVERERDAYEIKAVDSKGKRVKFYMNAVTGEILP